MVETFGGIWKFLRLVGQSLKSGEVFGSLKN